MSARSGIDLGELRASTPLAPLIGRSVQLRRSGRQWKGCCPFHGEKTPSFYVYDDHYHCFGCGAHGDAIAWVMQAEGLSFREAVSALAGNVQLGEPRRPRQSPQEAPRRPGGITSAYGARLVREAHPAISTSAERYLREHRGIPGPLPDGLLFHPRVFTPETETTYPAWLVPAYGPDGTLERVQAVLLDPITGGRPGLSNRKLTFGQGASHVPATFHARARGGWILLAEGPEDAVTLHSALGWQADASLGAGSLGKPAYPPGTHLVIFGDAGDIGHAQAEAAAAAHRTRGCIVVVVFAPDGFNDANDLLLARGADAVRACVQSACIKQVGFAPCDPPGSLPTASPAKVHEATLHAVHVALAKRGVQPAPETIIPGVTGSGKTTAIGKLLPHVIDADKKERELREGEPYRVLYTVPAHRLGRQIAGKYEQFARRYMEQEGGATFPTSVATLEGRGDPWKKPKPGTRPPLCRNLEAVGHAIDAGADVRRAVCGTANSSTRCRFYSECGYIRQFPAAAKADVLFGAHNYIFEPLPKKVARDIRLVIIDEDFTPIGDAISELAVDLFREASINRWPALDKDGAPDSDTTAELITQSARLLAVLDAEPDGHLAAGALSKAGLMIHDMNYLRHLHWKRRRDAGMHPAMSLEDRREAARGVEINRHLPRVAAMLRMLAAGENARLKLYTAGDGTRQILLHGQREVASWVKGKPVIHLNATAQFAKPERFFPSAQTVELPQPKLEYQTVHQWLGAFGKGGMSDRKRADFVARVRMHLAAGKTVLVICHEQDEHVFKALPEAKALQPDDPNEKPPLPQLRVLHHGDAAGDDDHGDVDLIMQIGGPFASYRAIAQIAAAREGVPVPEARPVRKPCVALMQDGTGRVFDRMAYEHPAAQRAHESIYDVAFRQGALGRGRGINRTAATPLAIEVYGNVPLPVPVASLQRWQHNRELAFLATGGTHSNADDLFRFHGPDEDTGDANVFPTVEAARRWRTRVPFDEAGLRALLATDPRPHVLITWQPQGKGQHIRRSIVAAAEAVAFRRRALRHFAGIKSWEAEPFTPGAKQECDTPVYTSQTGVSYSSEITLIPGATQTCQLANSISDAAFRPPDG